MTLVETLTTWVNSPPAQILAGGVIAAFIWKAFERVQAVVNDDINLAVAVWLLDLKPSASIAGWPATIAAISDSAFGEKLFSWKAFRRSTLLTTAVVLLVSPVIVFAIEPTDYYVSLLGVRLYCLVMATAFLMQVAVNVVPDFLSLTFMRFALRRLRDSSSPLFSTGMIVATICITLIVTLASSLTFLQLLDPVSRYATYIASAQDDFNEAIGFGLGSWMASLVAAAIGLFWLALYIISGFFIKLLVKSDRALSWFNDHIDIEKKPIQGLGLVAGGFAGLIYWAACFSSWLLH
jgi:hypothetical protein